jgi:hypothetical protein
MGNLSPTAAPPQVTVETITPFVVTENTTVMVQGHYLGLTTEVRAFL